MGLLAGCSADDGTGADDGGGGSGTATGGAVMGTGAVPNNGMTGGGGGTGGVTGGTGGSSTEGKMEVTCGIEVTRSEVSPDIATVGIVEFTTDLANVDSAVIQFGPTETYTLEAPVDLAEPSYRTLLLGMTQNATYHYRVAAFAGSNVCYSGDQTLQTGSLPNGGPSDLSPQTGPSTASVAPGFIVTTMGLQGSWVYIVNQDGELVWSYSAGSGGFGSGLIRARMSWDGKHMYARDLNVSGSSGQGNIYKIAMDGSSSETFSLSTSHHDFTVTSDNGVAYLAKEGSSGEGGQPCDAIRKIDENGGQDTVVYDLWDALADFDSQSQLGELCHANAIQYSAADDSFTVSELYRDVIVKVSSSGQLEWVVGGSDGDFSGITPWNAQHGHHLIDPTHLLFFNNNSNGQPSRAIELELDTSGMSAQEIFSYASGDTHSGQMGDTQRLPNGNTLVTFSVVGKMDEVGPDQQLVRSFSTSGFGYANFRSTLYGPPLR